jgi:glycosyltransferase involved in cell wall biosynthesis
MSSNVAFLKQARSTFSRAGAISLLLEAIQAQRQIDDTPELARQEAKALGRFRETSPNWRPDVSGPVEPLIPASPRRVLHLLKVSLPFRQSGYTVRTKYTLEGQLAAGLEPIAMTSLNFPRSVGVAEFPAIEDVGGVRHIRLDAGNDYDLDAPIDTYLQDYVRYAVPVVREQAPAIIHAHSGFRGYDSALVGLALAKHFRLPFVYEVRGFFESLWSANLEWSERSETYLRRFTTENRCMHEADAVVTLSESMRSEIVARGVSPHKVFVFPNGVDVEAFQPRPRPAELIQQLKVSDTFLFGYISNLDHYREGHEVLIDAAVTLRRRGIKATAVIVGDGRRRTELKRRVEELGATDFVIFTGRVAHDQVLDYYALLDVFVIPRVSERAARLVTPLKPFEAMAAGVPLVTSDLEALREIIGDGERGLSFTAGNAEALASVLSELEADPAKRTDMALRARSWVISERRWSANGERYAKLYERLHEGRLT